jgi:hypothetical protein
LQAFSCAFVPNIEAREALDNFEIARTAGIILLTYAALFNLHIAGSLLPHVF